jgi:hypothetical protein
MNTIIRLNQVRNAMNIIHLAITGTRSWIPTLGTWIRMRVKFAYHDQPSSERRGTEIDSGG